jgi:bifunctional non-homologous end joining protein LigD
VYTYDQVRTFAEVIARLVATERPDLFTTPRAVAAREKNKVYFDYLQIASGKTISAPYVVRAHSGAPVATPLAWDEVTPDLEPGQFTLANAADRFAQTGDLFKGVITQPQQLEKALTKLTKLLAKP